MPSGFYDRCLNCGEEITEFTDMTGFMRCPSAHDYRDVINDLMPKFSSEEKCKEAVAILKEGGYDVSGWSFGGNEMSKWWPRIPIIEELAERLMRHEKVNGALYHPGSTICKKCIEKSSHCIFCGHDHAPTCPICKTELVK